MANPSIRKEKENNQTFKNKEIREQVTNKENEYSKKGNNEEDRSDSNNPKEENTVNEKSNSQQERGAPKDANNYHGKHIRLAENQVRFDISDELNSTLCNITVKIYIQ